MSDERFSGVPSRVRDALAGKAITGGAHEILRASPEVSRTGSSSSPLPSGGSLTCRSCHHSIGGWVDGPILICQRTMRRNPDMCDEYIYEPGSDEGGGGD